MNKVRIGIAGLGNVGASVFNLIEREADNIELRTGMRLEVVAVSARDKSKDRGIKLNNVQWLDNPVDMASSDDIDIVVELLGGSEGKAFDLVSEAIRNNKNIVTANKALLALRSKELVTLLKNSKSKIYYEAAVAGAIPCIKVLREALSVNNVSAVYGIMNGTCNFILSEMTTTGRAFDDVLKEAQKLGYAEADPSFDINGNDAAHKLAILSALAFGGLPDYQSISLKGITSVSAEDIKKADSLDYRIKLIASAVETSNGVEKNVRPCLVRKDSTIANINGATNAVCFVTDYAGKIFMTGAGAGGNPTASAVVSDIVNLAQGGTLPIFSYKETYNSGGSDKIFDFTEKNMPDYPVLLVN